MIVKCDYAGGNGVILNASSANIFQCEVTRHNYTPRLGKINFGEPYRKKIMFVFFEISMYLREFKEMYLVSFSSTLSDNKFVL